MGESKTKSNLKIKHQPYETQNTQCGICYMVNIYSGGSGMKGDLEMAFLAYAFAIHYAYFIFLVFLKEDYDFFKLLAMPIAILIASGILGILFGNIVDAIILYSAISTVLGIVASYTLYKGE